MAKLFVLAIPAFGSALIGKVAKDNFDQWRRNIEALRLIHPKKLAVTPGDTQGANPNTHTFVNSVGPAYFGDTEQEVLYVNNVCVELLGEIHSDGSHETCKENTRLFDLYQKAVKNYAARHSSIVLPNVMDIHALGQHGVANQMKK